METEGKDIYRHPPLRYFGLSVEIAKAGIPFPFSFAAIPVAIIFRNSYVAMDLVDKSFPAAKNHGFPTGLTTAGDVLLWQTLASVTLPGAVLRCIRILAFRVFFFPPMPQILSLISIPAIVPSIDNATDAFMDITYRQIFGKTY